MNENDYKIAREWLADAPLYIDSRRVESFFDAVVRPISRLGVVNVTLNEEGGKKSGAELSGEISGGVFAVASGKAGGKATEEISSGSGKSREVSFEPINTPQRQLILLADHYQEKHKDRLFYVSDPRSAEWRNPQMILKVPRALVFLDLPGVADTGEDKPLPLKLIPTAAEFENNKIALIFSKLLAANGERPPSAPEKDKDGKSLSDLWNEYWKWFERISPRRAMEVVENVASENGRIRWIDYRLPLTKGGDTLHLHLQPAGQYDTGVLAYYLIQRGHKHGVRIVGTLKSEPDIDVLAIYEK